MNRKNNALVRSTLGIHTCRKYHEHGPAKVTLIYNTENMLAFGVSVKVAEYDQEMHNVTAWFSRDDVSDWLTDAAPGTSQHLGDCGMRVRKSAPHVLVIKLHAITLADGSTQVNPYVMVSRDFVLNFIKQTYGVIPRQSDDDVAIMIDTCIEQILGSK